ncbi:unnamed protein product [Mytilus coruscus]|uniref:Uncharacterized protein n=1 Tax=Mytilus coruscus TaxID=42192 RepID=A0A6J8EYR5_MYTCO|nr:unnamed protein product [Mytilus coruscus]
MVFSYPTLNKVSIIKEIGSVDFSLSVTAASGVAYNNEDNTIAISSCWGDLGNKITIIDLTKRKVEKTISPGGQIVGIVATNKTLLYQLYYKAIQFMDLTDASTRDITIENMNTSIKLTVSRHKLYYSSLGYHTVVCCDLDGTKQWSFKDENILKSPSGISADNNGNVYVVGYGMNNVVVISHDGQNVRNSYH